MFRPDLVFHFSYINYKYTKQVLIQGVFIAPSPELKKGKNRKKQVELGIRERKNWLKCDLFKQFW